LESARQILLRRGAVTDGFTGVDVRDDGNRMLLEFRWRRDPNTYVLGIDYPEDASSPWDGLPVDGAQQWAQDLDGLLMEELDTGLVARARRRARGDFVELDFHQDSRDRLPPGYYIGEVFAENEWIIANGGLDPSVPQRCRRDGTSVAWMVVHPNTVRPLPVVAHGSVSWVPGAPGVASLDMLEVVRDVPQEIAAALAETLVFLAAYEGATQVVAGGWAGSLQGIGFSARLDGSWSVETVGFGTTA
jgi:hypothetical protein